MTDTPSIVVKELSWLKSHLITLLVAAGIVFSGVYGIEFLVERHDKQKDQQWQAILAAQAVQTKQISDKLVQDEQNWTVQNAAQQQLIGQLSVAITARDAQLKKQQQIDATLTAQAAAERLSQQTKGNVVAQGDSVVADLPTARTIVSSLETLPTLQSDLSDTQKQLTAQTAVSTNLQANLAEQKQLTDSLKTQVTDGVKACQAQVSEVKAKARKNYLKIFLGGVVAGLALHFVGA